MYNGTSTLQPLTMNIHYAQQDLPKSIFLAGPTPRSKDVASWRPQACELLKQLGFTGTVLVPELASGAVHDSYDHQIHWEWEALNMATVVVFWVPRDLETLPAFTTNVEFGALIASGKVVFGFPEGAPKMRYLEELAARYGVPTYPTLPDTLMAAVRRTQAPFGPSRV